MKKIMAVLSIFFILSLGFSACGTNKDQLCSEFVELISGDSTSDNVRVSTEFLDNNISNVDKDTAIAMILAYEDFLIRYIKDKKDATLLKDLIPYFDKQHQVIDQEKIEKSELKQFLDDIMAGSLDLVYYEEDISLRMDYTELLDKYGTYLSEPYSKLYILWDKVTKKPISENATLAVSWDILLERAYEAEVLLKEYPEVEKIQTDAMWIYTTHINSILMGATNSPIFDYNTKEFSKKARDAYENFIHKNPDSTLTWVLKEYFTYLHSINYKLDYNDSTMSKVFFDTCDWLVSEAEKRVRE